MNIWASKLATLSYLTLSCQVCLGCSISSGTPSQVVGIENPNLSSSENNRILRYYGVGAQIIKELKIKKMILVSRTRKRIIALKGYGIKITKQEIIK